MPKGTYPQAESPPVKQERISRLYKKKNCIKRCSQLKQVKPTTIETVQLTLSLDQQQRLDVQITLEQIVNAIVTLNNFTARGSDSIIARDLTELMDISEESKYWKNREIMQFPLRIMKNIWQDEKVLEQFKEAVIRPVLKVADKGPKNPTNYCPVSLGRSTVDHLLVLQEIFFYYRYTKIGPRGGKGKKPLYWSLLEHYGSQQSV